MNTLNEERHNHTETSVAVEVSRTTEKLEIHLKNERSGLAFSITHFIQVFGSDFGNEFGVFLRRKGPPKPVFVNDNVRIHFLMIYTDLIEQNFVGDTMAPLLHCCPFISELQSGDNITTGQYMNYQISSILQFRPLLKNSSHNIHIDLRNTGGEKKPFVSVGITRLVLMFRKASNFHF